MAARPTARRETYDIAEWAGKLGSLIDDMTATQTPGVGGRGGKREVMKALKSKITAALEKGFTPSQIAETLRNGGFSVLPKTVTEIGKSVACREPVSRRERERSAKVKAQPNVLDNPRRFELARATIAPEKMDKSTFTIRPDTTDI